MVATVNIPKPHHCGCADCEWRGHEIERLRAGYCKQHSHLLPDMGCWVCRAQGAESRMEAALAAIPEGGHIVWDHPDAVRVLNAVVEALKGGE